ncbi:type I phosphomannose isomerase catalytic subunit [Paenibacillus filicis]|uniref:Phosphohexomutase n=1 Tax=Paenibacillus filicis TaxID=669464 RepID=A0ABU9DIL2_9BACL
MTDIDVKELSRQPIRLQSTRVWRTYSGGRLIDEWQGKASAEDSTFPEEWVASVVQATNVGREHLQEGLSALQLADGSQVTLKDVIASDPTVFLGKAHAEKYGDKTGVLVKVLDSSERLTIQVHPDREYAKTKFQSDFGKTEAWYVIGGREVDGEEPYVLFGFKPGVTPKQWKDLFDRQDIPGMLDAMHRIPVREGDVFLVQGGVPHSIGSGCFLIEIQEPTDYTLRTERTTPKGNVVPDQACHQGLGFDEMLNCFHYDTHTLEQVKDRWCKQPAVLEQSAGGLLTALIKNTDTDRFSMNRLTVDTEYSMKGNGTFVIAIVLKGSGTLTGETGETKVGQGDTFFLPASMTELKWARQGEEPLQVILCYPPGV